MIERVLNLNQRSVSSIMTSRHDIERINLSAPEEEIRSTVEKNQHTRLVVTGGKDNEDLLGVVHVIDLLQQSLRQEPLDLQALVRQPLVFPEGLPLLSALEQFRRPAPILPLWSMSLAPSRDCDPQRRDGDHRR